MTKPKGKHQEKRLSDRRVRTVREPGRYGDGNGLYLVVDPSGAKRWLQRIVVRGKRTDIGLGSIQLVSLAEAREQALAMRKIARSGGDPLAERAKGRRSVPTFEDAARRVHEDRENTWRNAKHRAQWINTLQTYVFPELGNRPIDQVDTPAILKILGPIWLTKPETARRVRQRISTVMDWAITAGFFDGTNPALSVSKGLPKQPSRKKHHAALPFCDLPSFVAELRKEERIGTSRIALEFLILTGARTGEVIGATWLEIDLGARMWAIPAYRMKAGREHRVPFGDRCAELLAQAKDFAPDSSYVFAGATNGKPLSNMALLTLLRRMGASFTTHGFRSCLSDWAAEKTHHSREVVEMALAHTIRNRTEASYRRGDLLEKRRRLMEDWERYVCQQSGSIAHFPGSGMSGHG